MPAMASETDAGVAVPAPRPPVADDITDAALTPEQTRALFDILSHHETYAEIESFKFPGAVNNYGFPFSHATTVPSNSQTPRGTSASNTPYGTAPTTPRAATPVPVDEDGQPSSSPLLQSLLTQLVLPLPGLRDLPKEFWSIRVQGILARFGAAELSESYDKGSLGLRKTLATLASSVIEMLGRGLLGGVKEREQPADADEAVEYDCEKAEDLERAWNDVVDAVVYGDLVDETFDHVAKTDDFEGLSLRTKVATQYTHIHLATFLHYIFILSPEGPYLLKLIENVHGLVPYKMIKQTLRVGNAATMISAMMRLLLAKLSVTSLTNWVGLTHNADDGMNLLQRIVSLTLSWDASEFKKTTEKVDKERPGDEMLKRIRDFVGEGREEHEAVRQTSMDHQQSIITAIANAYKSEQEQEPNPLPSNDSEIENLEYYSSLLSIRDRDAITAVLCRQTPDLFTQMVREAVAAYEPMIRDVHSRVDLKEHLESGQAFIDDFIKAGKPKKVNGGLKAALSGSGGERMASVEDYVQLIKDNKILMYRWLHAVASKCPDVWEELRKWTKDAAIKFRQTMPEPRVATGSTTGDLEAPPATVQDKKMDVRLQDLYRSLPAPSKAPVLAALDAHAAYLGDLESLSRQRLQSLLQPAQSKASAAPSTAGPGAYLTRWQSLLDNTLITPVEAHGPLRHGRDVKDSIALGKTVVDGGEASADRQRVLERAEKDVPTPPDVSVVVDELGKGFVEALQNAGVQIKGA